MQIKHLLIAVVIGLTLLGQATAQKPEEYNVRPPQSQEEFYRLRMWPDYEFPRELTPVVASGSWADDNKLLVGLVEHLLEDCLVKLEQDWRVEAEMLARLALWFDRNAALAFPGPIRRHENSFGYVSYSFDPLAGKRHVLARTLCNSFPFSLKTQRLSDGRGTFLPTRQSETLVCWCGWAFLNLQPSQDRSQAIRFLLEQSREAMLAGQTAEAENLAQIALGIDRFAVMDHPLVRDMYLLQQVLSDPDTVQSFPRLLFDHPSLIPENSQVPKFEYLPGDYY